MHKPEHFDWKGFWEKKAQSLTDFEATGRGSMNVLGFLNTIREVAGILELNKEDRILDIGCGTGIVAMALSPWVKSIHGIDISTNAVERASKNCSNIDNVNFSVGNILYLDNLREEFEKVCGYSVLQYLKDEHEVEQAFRSVGSVISSKGLILMAANPDPGKFDEYMKKIAKNDIPEDIREYTIKITKETLWLSQEKMIECAENTGFEATILPINDSIWQSFYMYDVLLKRR